jgi:spore coat polysaccharide biosynthesis protein SpsF
VLKDIEGKPLLKWIVDRMQAVKGVNEVVLCTSDDPGDAELLERADEWGIPSIAGSPENIVSRLQKAADTFQADIVLRATGDNPLVSVEYTERMVNAHQESECEYSRVNSLPLGATVEGISESILPEIQNSLPSPSHSEYLVLYAFRPDLYDCTVVKPPGTIRRPYYSVTVDTPDDLRRARRIFAETNGKVEVGPSIHDVIQFLDDNQEYEGISGGTKVKMPEGGQKSYDEFLELLENRTSKSTIMVVD